MIIVPEVKGGTPEDMGASITPGHSSGDNIHLLVISTETVSAGQGSLPWLVRRARQSEYETDSLRGIWPDGNAGTFSLNLAFKQRDVDIPEFHIPDHQSQIFAVFSRI